jgi:hypothetical protein
VFREGPKQVYDFEKLIEHEGEGIYFHVEPAGTNYLHVLTPAEILVRLHALPDNLLSRLTCVVLPRMTRKRKLFNIYGMQWDKTIYLYPMPASLRVGDEHSLPASYVAEARQFGATVEETPTGPVIQWSLDTIKQFYLENILLHELGHTLDTRNSSTRDREAFAEAFARKYGRWPKRKPRRSYPKPAGLVPKDSPDREHPGDLSSAE